MVRVGTRYWLGFLLVAWGAVAACFSLVSSAGTFYLLRALLGAFEAGAFPAMWHSLSTFYPRNRITKPFAYLTSEARGEQQDRVRWCRQQPGRAYSSTCHALQLRWPCTRALTPPARAHAPPVAVMVANMIGAPIAAGLLAMDGVAGLK